MTDATILDNNAIAIYYSENAGKTFIFIAESNSRLDDTHSYSLQASFLRCIGHISTNRNNLVSLQETNRILHKHARME